MRRASDSEAVGMDGVTLLKYTDGVKMISKRKLTSGVSAAATTTVQQLRRRLKETTFAITVRLFVWSCLFCALSVFC